MGNSLKRRSRKNGNVRANWTGNRQCNISRHGQHRRIRRQRGRSPRWNEHRKSRDIPSGGNGNASHRTTGPSIKRERPLLRARLQEVALASAATTSGKFDTLVGRFVGSRCTRPFRVIAEFAFDKFHYARVPSFRHVIHLEIFGVSLTKNDWETRILS